MKNNLPTKSTGAKVLDSKPTLKTIQLNIIGEQPQKELYSYSTLYIGIAVVVVGLSSVLEAKGNESTTATDQNSNRFVPIRKREPLYHDHYKYYTISYNTTCDHIIQRQSYLIIVLSSCSLSSLLSTEIHLSTHYNYIPSSTLQ